MRACSFSVLSEVKLADGTALLAGGGSIDELLRAAGFAVIRTAAAAGPRPQSRYMVEGLEGDSATAQRRLTPRDKGGGRIGAAAGTKLPQWSL